MRTRQRTRQGGRGSRRIKENQVPCFLPCLEMKARTILKKKEPRGAALVMKADLVAGCFGAASRLSSWFQIGR